ncbi:MAG: tRNA uridine-5-carboxymethylaminomethyl(34) synthesis GTPase MnmE [Erysipelotrichaceae bacterium]|nr:tRNA uridine-5-carboxymethylaminomethyl(34) synthesis GTPase MnmE [Erysipelotrichaceae bacterium]
MFEHTIAAISTPLAMGAISIVRISGNDAIDIAGKVLDIPISDAQSHTIHYGHVIDQNNQVVDEVLVSVFRAPKTYTREDIVEINCHGGVFITRKILTLLYSAGAKPANPGEFTQRAFYHGRIDLTQAEAVQEMIESTNETASQMAIKAIGGSVKSLLDPLIEDILNIIAQIEVNIDYPEYEDIEQLTQHELLPKVERWLFEIDAICKRAQTGQLAKHGIDTVIVGRPNVGKSSLLNALLEEDKAIVTDIAGTTRDIVEGKIHIGQAQFNLIDTAGIRQSENEIEKIGIEKTIDKLEQAQLVIVVLDGSQPITQEDQEILDQTKQKTRIIVHNKKDRLQTKEDGVWISAKNNDIQPLLDRMEALYAQDVLKEDPLLSNERQIGLLNQAKESMQKAKEALTAGVEPDLAEVDIQNAHTCLKEILGTVHRDDLLDALFSKFCLGK